MSKPKFPPVKNIEGIFVCTYKKNGVKVVFKVGKRGKKNAKKVLK